MSEKLDVIIFGASGFTGKYCVFEACSVLENLKWGIAGRNQEKLEAVLKEMGKKADKDLSKIPIIIANINDEKSLADMASKAKIIVNCCGPYRFFGEQVVKACVEAGTHHVDVSGEPQYMESMQLKYNDLAKEKGVYVVSACGFDSIPSDLGVIFLEKNFEGVINSVETYLESYTTGGSYGGASIHYGTWESAVYGLAHAGELREIRSKLYNKPLPKFQPKLKARSVIHTSDVINAVCLPFPGSDKSVIQRSQRFLFETEKKRPIQVQTYVGFRSMFAALIVAFVGIVFGIMTKFALGRKLLLNYPQIFSFGFISHEGPSEEKSNATRFKITIKGNGWPKTDKLAEPTDQFTDPPSKNLIAKVTGPNPGYGATCVALLVAATTILKDSDKMPGSGGVLPPGAAFAKTNMIAELEKYDHGIKFEIVANK